MITKEELEAERDHLERVVVLNNTSNEPGNYISINKYHQRQIEILTSALERLAMEPRPISEAPDDGTEVFLIRNTKNFQSIGIGSFGVARMQDDGYRAGGGNPHWLQQDKVHLAAEPTHFIPISALPKVKP